jgi:hypothetical protein
VIRAGAGIVEERPGWDAEALPPELRRRALVLDEHDAVPSSFLGAMGSSFRVSSGSGRWRARSARSRRAATGS